MERYDLETWGDQLCETKGYIAHVTKGKYEHRFGGTSWKIVDEHCMGNTPTLILVLDLQDSRLITIGSERGGEIPMCSYLNGSGMRRQVYSIMDNSKEVVLEDPGITVPMEMAKPEYRFPNPLPERALALRDMAEEDYPLDEDSYYGATHQFLAGKSFIRVLGPPLWMQWVEEEFCTCGRKMTYVASIGHDWEYGDGHLLQTEPFFPGEHVCYFHYCSDCSVVVTNWQPT